MRGGFITDSIPGYSEDCAEKDERLRELKLSRWICVIDYFSSYCEDLNGDTLNICAWYHKDHKYCYFGGQWAYDVPPLAIDHEPTEETILYHAKKYSWVCKRMAANTRRKAKFKNKLKELEAHQKKNGINWVYCILELNGEILKIQQPIGEKNVLEVLQLVRQNIAPNSVERKEKYFTYSKYYGAKIKRLVVKKASSSDLEIWHKGGKPEWDKNIDIIKNK